jgi:hypothetical protein
MGFDRNWSCPTKPGDSHTPSISLSRHRDRARNRFPAFRPELFGKRDRIDFLRFPPASFVAGIMERAMMQAAERDDPLIARLARHGVAGNQFPLTVAPGTLSTSLSRHSERCRDRFPAFRPELFGKRDGVDFLLVPPTGFVACIMERTVVQATQRHDPLIAGFFG